jgi:4-hydroxybenzoate polyprenyltransferase
MALRARLAGVWAVMHPGPSLLTVGAYLLCAFIAAGGRPAPARLAFSALGMVCMQFAISALNDYCDRAADARNPAKRQRKPLVLGLVSPAFALGAALALAVAMFALFIPFGPVSVALAAIFLALGFAYDLGIKATPASGLMHGLAFPTIPLLAWEIFARLTPALFTAIPLGLALGIGIHLADAIPDAEADAAAGVHGLTQALSARAPFACWGAFGAAISVVGALALAHARGGHLVMALSGAALALALLLGAIRSFRAVAVPAKTRYRRHFLLLVGAALTLVVAWFAAVA